MFFIKGVGDSVTMWTTEFKFNAMYGNCSFGPFGQYLFMSATYLEH
jgi:hypothetical protein